MTVPTWDRTCNRPAAYGETRDQLTIQAGLAKFELKHTVQHFSVLPFGLRPYHINLGHDGTIRR